MIEQAFSFLVLASLGGVASGNGPHFPYPHPHPYGMDQFVRKFYSFSAFLLLFRLSIAFVYSSGYPEGVLGICDKRSQGDAASVGPVRFAILEIPKDHAEHEPIGRAEILWQNNGRT